MQKIFMGGGVHSVAYGGHFHLLSIVCDVTIVHQIPICKPTFWPSLLTQYAYSSIRTLFYVSLHWI